MHISDLEKKLGYFFSDSSLLSLALTHKSFSSKNNERLEFIGDAVLGYVIATDLYSRHKELHEDALSLMRVALVRGDMLSEVALECGLADHLLLGPGELKSGGRTRPSARASSTTWGHVCGQRFSIAGPASARAVSRCRGSCGRCAAGRTCLRRAEGKLGPCPSGQASP